MDQLFLFFESPVSKLLLQGVLIFLGLLWFALLIWVGRDIVQRSNSVVLQIFVLLLNILLPGLGLILYLILRPSKTLAEQYCEAMECQMFSTCPRCQTPVESEFFYCPSCAFRIKQKCKKCRKAFSNGFTFCPFCGKKRY